MKKIIALLLSAVLFLSAAACDICGGGLNNLNPYLFPHLSKSYLGVSYFHNHYRLNEDGQITNQYNNAFVFSGQYTFSNKVQVMALVPFQFNTMTSENIKASTQGIGDVTVLANYTVLTKMLFKTSHAFSVGAGLKLPSGEYNKVKNDPLNDQNFQLGSGSLDYLLNASCRFGFGNFILSTLGAYKYTTSNKDGYRYGDVLTTGATAVYQVKAGQFSLAPYLQAVHETHYRDAAQHVLQNHSGGDVLYTGAGLDISAKRITIGMNYQVAANQNLVQGELQAKPRLSARLSFSL